MEVAEAHDMADRRGRGGEERLHSSAAVVRHTLVHDNELAREHDLCKEQSDGALEADRPVFGGDDDGER